MIKKKSESWYEVMLTRDMTESARVVVPADTGDVEQAFDRAIHLAKYGYFHDGDERRGWRRAPLFEADDGRLGDPYDASESAIDDVVKMVDEPVDYEASFPYASNTHFVIGYRAVNMEDDEPQVQAAQAVYTLDVDGPVRVYPTGGPVPEISNLRVVAVVEVAYAWLVQLKLRLT